ncbi:MAG TPA: phospholipid methyltransferase [Xanthomonadaceae bacterium]|jgi:phosphatidylethanolamine/phosphatidyl-N-methylethanolamine N-methyltransferase|nr:phospholipid methyltransferase [Xanthomonadaceae bacterium]
MERLDERIDDLAAPATSQLEVAPIARPRSDIRTFINAWWRDPKAIGALAPSSRALARLITSRVGPDNGPIIELGPGTGVFTDALLARGVRAQDLFLIESQPNLAALLRERFPQACVLQMDAAKLGALDPLDARLAGAAVSGLPILWFPRPAVEQILRGLFAQMRPDAALYQFTYQLHCPISHSVLIALGLEAKCIGRVFANLPPAAVYRIVRRT